MKLAVLSDIHGNALALDVVLADLDAQGGADALIVAGDLCLDGPRPREVIERLRALGCPVVQGNTDRDLVRPTAADEDDDHAALLAWTRQQIGPNGLAYLADLPFSHRVPDPTGATAVLVVHANPRDLDTHLRPLAPEETVAPFLAGLQPDIAVVAFGHLHIPYTRRIGGVLLADISSAGLPKDGDRRAGYGLLTWDGEDWSVEQRRVEYPVDEVVAQLRVANPPGAQRLIRRLLSARYPNMSAARGGRQPAPRATSPRRAATQAAASVADAAPELARAARPVAPIAPLATELDPPVAAAPVAGSEPGDPGALVAPAASPAAPAETAGAQLGESPVGPAGEPLVAPPAAKAGRRKKAKRAAKAASQITFEAGDSFPAILPRLLAERLDTVVAPMETVRRDEDPEGVHDMRVAIRRLRGALEPAEPFYPEKGYKRAVRRARNLARALGHVRDADVHLIDLRVRLAAAPPEERAGIQRLIDGTIADRTVARADLDPVLDRWDGNHAPHLAELRAFLGKATPRKGKGRDRDSVAAVALRTLTDRLDGLEEVAGVLGADDHGDPEAFHEVRIAAKQLRYALEIFAPVLGPDIGDLLAELKTLQDLLGELHDRDVLIELLRIERVEAAQRDLDACERIALEPGPRGERLAALRAELDAPDGFIATAPGGYGLLIDLYDERIGLQRATRERWATLSADGFLDRLRDLTDMLRAALADLAAPQDTLDDDAAVEEVA